MRTYGRVYDLYGRPTWVQVSTDVNGRNDLVWITTLIQCLKLSPGESPFYANYGIPAQRSVITQIFPDYYVTLTQRQFSQYFASLLVKKLNSFDPVYEIDAVTHVGVVLNRVVPV